MQTKYKVMIVGALIISVIGVLIVMGVAQTASYYMTIDEFFDQKETLSDRTVKLSGFIVDDSVVYDEQNLLLSFDIQDEVGEERLSVTYQGIKPDTFIDGWETIVDGRLNEEGIFVATELLVKCPSKYEAEDGEYNLEDGPYESRKSYPEKNQIVNGQE